MKLYMSWLLLALLGATCAGCEITRTRIVVVTATPAHPAATSTAPVSLGAFVLTGLDVPAGLSQTLAQFHNNADVASTYGLDPRELTHRGRIMSYETEFKQQAASGMLQVDDVVASWKTPAGAHWDFQRVVQTATHPTVPQIGVTPIPAPRLGDERRAFSFRSANQGSNIEDYAVIFRRGPYRVYLQVIAITETVSNQDVLKLARLIDSRIQSTR